MHYCLATISLLFCSLCSSYGAPVTTIQKASNDAHSLTVCSGQMRSITCPNLQLLHVYNAFYGKLSGHDCQDPVSQLRDEVPTCFSKDAPKIIREACQGQQSCDLYAEDSLYHDPCPSVTKYLFVSFTCQGKTNLAEQLKLFDSTKKDLMLLAKQPLMEAMPKVRHETLRIPEILSAVVCAGQKGSIYCPELKLLRIKSAFYGKQNRRSCTGSPTNDTIPTCYARDTVETVKTFCDGMQSCDLYSEENLYGRTLCPENAQKYLQVDYTCEGHTKLADTHQNFPAISNSQPQNLYVRSSIAYPNAQQNYYSQLQSYWKTGFQQPPSLRSLPNQPVAANQRSYPSAPQWPSRSQQDWTQRQMIAQQQTALPYGQSWSQAQAWPTTSYFMQPQSSCDQCNGDCSNFLCYGCGGCPEPPPEQQTYYYPYQRQDARYHDAFKGNEMSLSGLVIWPVPKAPASWHLKSKTGATRSNIGKHYDDEDDDDDDDQDENDEDDSDEQDDEKISKSKPLKNKVKREIYYDDSLPLYMVD